MREPIKWGAQSVSAAVMLSIEPAELEAFERNCPRHPDPAKNFVLYWPGVVEIPWPAGMTIREAIAAWKGGLGR